MALAETLTTEQVREARIREAREFYLAEDGSGFLDFVKDCGAAKDAEWEPHGRGARWVFNWQGEPDPDNPKVINYKWKLLLWPRGSFKSQVFTVGLTCWLIAKNPNIRIFIGSETNHQAEKFMRNAMEIIESPWFVEHFGVHKDSKRWSYVNGFYSAQRTEMGLKDPTLAAFGAGKVQTGAHWDFGFIDDPVSQENSITKESRDKVENWVGELTAQLDPGSRALFIGTIHHHDDFWVRTIKNPNTVKHWQVSIHAAVNSDGSMFFPKRITRTFLQNQREKIASSRQFYAYYYNKPQSEEEQIFLPEYFRVIDEQEIPRLVWTYIFTDFAFTSQEMNDRTCFWVVSFDTHRYAYVRDVIVGRWKPEDSITRMCELYDRYMYLEMKGVAIEKSTHHELLMGYIEEIRRKTMIRPRIIEMARPKGDTKFIRIEALEPRFKQGRIYFTKELRAKDDVWKTMFAEMIEWPFSSHDDIPDAAADMDAVDKNGRHIFPGPPAYWTPHVSGLPAQPSMINGQFNPEVRIDARERIKNLSKKNGLWSQPARSRGKQDPSGQLLSPVKRRSL